MKHIFVVLFSFAACAFGQGSQQKDLSDANGSSWRSASETSKLGYISGYISAMEEATVSTAYLCGWQGRADSEPCTVTIKALDFSGITVGQYLNGMDAFYKDFRDTQYPQVAAMRIVRDQINGRPAEDIEKELVAWRQCHAAHSGNCLHAANSYQITPSKTPRK
jgi:hypothetical protein